MAGLRRKNRREGRIWGPLLWILTFRVWKPPFCPPTVKQEENRWPETSFMCKRKAEMERNPTFFKCRHGLLKLSGKLRVFPAFAGFSVTRKSILPSADVGSVIVGASCIDVTKRDSTAILRKLFDIWFSYKHWISHTFAYSSRWRWKPWRGLFAAVRAQTNARCVQCLFNTCTKSRNNRINKNSQKMYSVV